MTKQHEETVANRTKICPCMPAAESGYCAKQTEVLLVFYGLLYLLFQVFAETRKPEYLGVHLITRPSDGN